MQSLDDGGIRPPNLGQVNRNLHARGQFLARFMPDTFNVGISVADVVGDVWAEYFSSPDRLGWDPSKCGEPNDATSSLTRFLSHVLHCRIIDHIRRNRRGNQRFAGSIDDRNLAAPGCADPELDRVEFKELLARLKEEAGGDAEIERLIDAALQINGQGKVDLQLGDILGMSPKQVVNLKKRFRRKLKEEGWIRWTKLISSTSTAAARMTRRGSGG